jgi:hypothetical protein
MIKGQTAEGVQEVHDMLDRAADMFDSPAPPAVTSAAGSTPGHIAGLAPVNIRPPSWWRGDRAAFRSMVAAGKELGEPAALREPDARAGR